MVYNHLITSPKQKWMSTRYATRLKKTQSITDKKTNICEGASSHNQITNKPLIPVNLSPSNNHD